MAILYGTQSNGETLPVLVDQFGNLLAKGIDGPQGEPGPPGADGGDFALPPDPYEGAFLGWLNNGLAWIGTPPVPVPEGVFGPITNWDPFGLLVVEGEIPPQVAQGVFVYQCNPDGSIYVGGWNNSQKWSAGVNTADLVSASSLPTFAFDGNFPDSLSNSTNSTSWANANATYTYTFPTAVTGALKIWAGTGAAASGGSSSLAAGGTTLSVLNPYNAPEFFDFGTVTNLDEISITCSTGHPVQIGGMTLDGATLADQGDYPTAPNLNFRVQSVSGQSLIGTANRTEDFSIGKYLRVPEQNVARWLYDGNLNKVITSTGIDISRLTGN